jgi:hypothetical protein
LQDLGTIAVTAFVWKTLWKCDIVPAMDAVGKREVRRLGKRQEPRMPAKLHVRIAGVDDNGRPILLMVPTRNVSRQGALLEGIQGMLKVGQVVTMTHKTSKARFRVMWVGDGERAGQIGVQTVETEKCIWDAAVLPSMTADLYVAPAAKERKGSP